MQNRWLQEASSYHIAPSPPNPPATNPSATNMTTDTHRLGSRKFKSTENTV